MQLADFSTSARAKNRGGRSFPRRSATPARRAAARLESGLTLVELMIAMLIGLIVLGAVMLTVANTGINGRQQQADSEISENGQMALQLLATDIRRAGYQPYTPPLVSSKSLNPNDGQNDDSLPVYPVYGCEGTFSHPAATGEIECGSGLTGAIQVYYAVDPSSGEGGLIDHVPTPGEPAEPEPRDCLGNVFATQDPPSDIYIYNRYYIANTDNGEPALYCHGNGGNGQATSQALVSGVESMHLTYGVAATLGNRNCPPKNPYDSASDVQNGNHWGDVSTVRICIIMRSSHPVTGQTSYHDCDEKLVTPTDHYLRRAMSTTVMLRNASVCNS